MQNNSVSNSNQTTTAIVKYIELIKFYLFRNISRWKLRAFLTLTLLLFAISSLFHWHSMNLSLQINKMVVPEMTELNVYLI